MQTPIESQHTEWKESWRDDHLRWICGFANAFFRAGEIETWGRGIQRIFEACENAGAPAPIIDYKPNDLWLEFPFSPDYLMAIDATPQDETLPKPTLGKTSGKIVALMNANAQTTIPEMAEAIGVTERSVERQIKALQQQGLVRRIGPAKGGHWQVISK